MMMKVKVVKFDPFFSHLNQQTRKVLQQNGLGFRVNQVTSWSDSFVFHLDPTGLKALNLSQRTIEGESS
ncbi:hypothetical protein HanPSC8_Chr01g0000201 [Helianthus annuus]|nr:hypothetical protein HanIR_Chr01g0000491 [Helianthus annuus]KAJ0625328.1 hypothetical protein HanHA89_Chr01g0000431 [Helianthus annuus]KAJ0955205.1 hypothetical protein HanPSC8_Chr01g0000201 [Helianthus annuus]